MEHEISLLLGRIDKGRRFKRGFAAYFILPQNIGTVPRAHALGYFPPSLRDSGAQLWCSLPHAEARG